MRPTQLFLVLVGLLATVAIIMTIVAVANAPSFVTDPFTAWAWWHSGFGLAAMILWMVLFWGLLIGGVIWLIVALNRREVTAGGDAARDILQQRYARGEITREQYDEMRRELR